MSRSTNRAIQAITRRLRDIPSPSRVASGSHRPRMPREPFLAKINGAADQSGVIWHYGFDQVTLNADGSTTVLANGYSGSSLTDDHALNLAEIANTGSGLQHNGIDADTLCEGIAFQPAPDGKIVKMWYEYIHDQTPPYRAFFDYDNAVDGVPV